MGLGIGLGLKLTRSYAGASVIALSALLLESGGHLLLESGGRHLLEGGSVSSPAVTYGTVGDRTDSSFLSGKTLKNLKTDYGAVGNGVADDTTALANAFAALQNNYALYIPTGTYNYHGTKSMPTGKTGVVIYGDGPGLSILNSLDNPAVDNGTGGGSAIIPAQQTNCTLRDFAIYAPNTTARVDNGTGGVAAGRGINGDTSTGLTIYNVLVDGVSGAGILNAKCSGTTITHCKVQNTWADGIHNTGLGTSNVLVQYNWTSNTGDDGIATVGYNPSELTGIQILDNLVEDSAARGISILGTDGYTALRNRIYRTAYAGIYIATEGPPYFTNYVTNILLEDNYLEDVVTLAATGHGAVMVFAANANVSNVTFNRTTIVNPRNATQGFRMYGTAGVSGNTGQTMTVQVVINSSTLTNTTGAMVTAFAVTGTASLVTDTGTGNTFNGSPAALP